MQADFPLTRDLVLVGGGHSHALVLRMWGMNPLPGVRVTVINPGPVAAYSGMLPGHVAGHYTEEELELDLVKLARFAGARLIMERAVAMDPEARRVTLESGREVAFDVASIDIGIHSEMPAIKGFSTFAVGAKPLDQFAKRWRAHLEDLRAGDKNGTVAVIGGGVAGVELALTMAHAVKDAGKTPKITVIDRSEPLKGVNKAARAKLLGALAADGGEVISGAEVVEIGANSVTLADGRNVEAALCVGVAGAVPHGFNTASGLALEAGFIRVDKHLQVEGRAGIFAAGDCAHMVETPRPKAGVFAVRAAPVLFANLRAALTGGTLRAFKPQKHYLKLVSLGPKSALAERGRWAFSGPLLWLWKDRIDRKFMSMLKDLPAMARVDIPVEKALGLSDMLAEKPLCGGCGAKVGPGVLNDGLCRLPAIARPDVISGPGDDAAVLAIGGERQVLTTDHLRAFTNDPVAMTRITILHAMGDVWAMGAEPQAALLSLILPRQSEAMQARIMEEILSAANDLLSETGAALVGGHTTMGSEMTVGLTLTGLAQERVIGVDGAKAGDALILTRPLGSGILLAAEMQGAANGKDVAQLLEIMQQSQGKAAEILRPFANAMTDVTGFGLAGHLRTMAKGAGLAAWIDADNISVYQGVRELVAKGHGSALTKANRAAAPVSGAEALGWMAEALHDPQTAGGFLAAVPAERADQLINDLKSAGYPASCVGHLLDGPAGQISASKT
jgi:selenide,water dikinase